MYKPEWDSLRLHPTPKWFKEAKFGIYTHWGVYSVPACGPNATWYPCHMYREGNEQYAYHVKTYGGPDKFGYKDFIPMFTGEKFDPEEWAELFAQSGARFAGPVGEHHDGFCMWDTKYSDWNAKKMGPKRDVVGLLEKAIRAEGMKYLVALHHAENWWFYAHWRKDCDTSDPRYVGLYGELHNLNGQIKSDHWFFDQDRPSKRFMETWKNKSREVIDKYRPDVLWFDFGLRGIPEQYRQELMAYYYNTSARKGREVAITFKDSGFAPGTGVQDFELGRLNALAHHDWITDSTVDDGQGWGYLKQTGYKTPASVIHYLVDNVSKNGALLLNIGPKPNGEIPDEAKAILKEMGKWLAVNGEAIFGTSNWLVFGEGPVQLKKTGELNENEKLDYSAKDVRFTAKGNALYVTCLGWPTGPVTIETLKSLYAAEIKSVRMLGVDRELKWTLDGKGLTIVPPAKKPCEHAYVFKIVRGKPY